MLRQVTVLICFLSIMSLPEQGKADPLVFASFPIPLMVESETEGVFIDLAHAVGKKLGQPIEIKVFPPKRAIQSLVSGQVDVLFPALDTFFADENQFHATSELIYIKEDFVFTRKQTPQLVSQNDLVGRVVGLTRGYPYAKTLTSDSRIHFDYSSSDEKGVQKLMLGRTDAFVVEEKSGLKAFEKTGTLTQMQYDPQQPLSKQDVYFACEPSSKGKLLAQHISKALAEMKADGSFDAIVGQAKQHTDL